MITTAIYKGETYDVVCGCTHKYVFIEPVLDTEGVYCPGLSKKWICPECGMYPWLNEKKEK